MMKEYILEIKIKNNYLASQMRLNDVASIPELSSKSGISLMPLYNISNLKHKYYLKHGVISNTIIKLSEFLKCLPEDIYPPQHREAPLVKNKFISELSVQDLAQIQSMSQHNPESIIEFKENKLILNNYLDSTLTEREKNIIDKHYGLSSGNPMRIVDISKDMNISRSRIGQILNKSLRKLQNSKKINTLRELSNISGSWEESYDQ